MGYDKKSYEICPSAPLPLAQADYNTAKLLGGKRLFHVYALFFLIALILMFFFVLCIVQWRKEVNRGTMPPF